MESIYLGTGKCGLYKQMVFIQAIFRSSLTIHPHACEYRIQFQIPKLITHTGQIINADKHRSPLPFMFLETCSQFSIFDPVHSFPIIACLTFTTVSHILGTF